MGGYVPAYASNNEQPANSRHNPNRSLRQNSRNQNQPTQQVDAWRSYRNDVTNLQQSTNFVHSQSYNHVASAQDSPYYMNQYGLNPMASAFQPINQNQTSPIAYQPLRVPNGQYERQIMQQASYALASMNDDGGRQHTLPPRGSANPRTVLRDSHLSNIEQQTRYSSSIPMNLQSYSSIDTSKRITRSSVLQVSSPPVSSPPAPSPTKEYLLQAALSPKPLVTPQKLLVVLDLNGTLLKRGTNSRINFVLRPGVAKFMDYLFANHMVMIYSSARPANVQGMVAKLLSPKQRNKLVAIWARDQLGLDSEQYYSKVQVYKRLEKIWADKKIQQLAGRGRKWNQSNTVLLDDTHLKALAQPYNLLRVEEFVNDKPGADTPYGKIQDKEHIDALNVWSANQLRIIKDLEIKLELLKWTEDVSQLIRQWQLTDAEEQAVASEQIFKPEPVQLMTPVSLKSEDSASDQSDGGVDATQRDIDELVRQLGQQCVNAARTASRGDVSISRSVSPINEAIWRDILGGVEQDKDVPPTPRSMDG